MSISDKELIEALQDDIVILQEKISLLEEELKNVKSGLLTYSQGATLTQETIEAAARIHIDSAFDPYRYTISPLQGAPLHVPISVYGMGGDDARVYTIRSSSGTGDT
jgi:hypothetical protein